MAKTNEAGTVLEAVAEAISQANDANLQLAHVAAALEAIVDINQRDGEQAKVEAIATMARIFVGKIEEMNEQALGAINSIKHVYEEAHRG
jgi:hypothetical protein